jgi:hypothetical protein
LLYTAVADDSFSETAATPIGSPRPAEELVTADIEEQLETPRERFLEAFVELASIRQAAKRAGINRATHYKWLKEDEAYAETFRFLREDVIEALEEEADRRGRDGVLKPFSIKARCAGILGSTRITS